MAIELTDDGTLDTVLRCADCGEEFRFNYQTADARPVDEIGRPPTEREQQADYDAWLAECIVDVTAEHTCERCGTCGEVLSEEERDADAAMCESCWRQENEPQDGDITTEDHRTFYQDGKRVLELDETPSGRYVIIGHRGPIFNTVEAAIRAYMDRVQYWPNVWWISDHGNAHRIDLTEGK